MTRVVTYNILAGGYSLRENGARRTLYLTNILRSVHPDIVGLVEATHPMIRQNPLVVEEISDALGMQLLVGASPRYDTDYQLALLTRLPVVHTKLHDNPALHKPLLEVCVEIKQGQLLTIFLAHLWGAFHLGRGGQRIRYQEVQNILQIMAFAREQKIPHLFMGDCNSLAPGDPFKASSLVSYILNLDHGKHDSTLIDGHPQLDSLLPPHLRFLSPALRAIPSHRSLSLLFDSVASLYAPRDSIHLLLKANYTDCYRCHHPHAEGFTCPSLAPAGRIDFIFACPEMRDQLKSCDVLVHGEGTPGSLASDHLAVAAEFIKDGVISRETLM